MFRAIQLRLGIQAILDRLGGQSREIRLLREQITVFRSEQTIRGNQIMATIEEILQAQATGAELIQAALADISTEVAEVLAAIEAAAAGTATPEQLATALANAQSMNAGLAQISDSVKAIIVTTPTPEMPTDPGTPVEPVLPVEVPSDVDGVVIGETGDVGLPGVPAIDVE